MASGLDAAMKAKKIGDAELGAACVPPIHRTLIWCYRKRKKMPRADTAQAILAALKTFGVDMTLTDLLGPPSRRNSAA